MTSRRWAFVRHLGGLGLAVALQSAASAQAPVQPAAPKPPDATPWSAADRPPRLQLGLDSDLRSTAADPMQAGRRTQEDDFVSALVDSKHCAQAAAVDTRRPLTLGTVLGAVICRYTNRRIGETLVMQSRAALARALAQNQPAVSVSAGFDTTRNAGSSSTLELRAEWVLFDFGQRSAAGQQARQALQAVLDDQKAEVLLAMAQATTLFAAAQGAVGKLDATAVNLQTARDNSKAAAARSGAGAATPAERLQAETAAAQAQVEHGRALRQWLLTRGELALAMGLPANQPVEVIAPEPERLDPRQAPDLDALLQEAADRHPRIAAARARVAEGQAQAAAVEAGRWGNVTLAARAGRVRASSESEIGSSSTASINWSVPLWDRNELRYRRDDAQAQVLARNHLLDDARRQVTLQVWQEAQAVLGERELLAASRPVLDSAAQALKVASERFRQGVGNFADVLTAQTVAANVLSQRVETRVNLSRAEVRLAAALGRFSGATPP